METLLWQDSFKVWKLDPMLLTMYGLLASLWFKKGFLRTNLPRFQSSRLEKLLFSRLPGAKPNRDFFPALSAVARFSSYDWIITNWNMLWLARWDFVAVVCGFHWITAVLYFSPLHCDDNRKCMWNSDSILVTDDYNMYLSLISNNILHVHCACFIILQFQQIRSTLEISTSIC